MPPLPQDLAIGILPVLGLFRSGRSYPSLVRANSFRILGVGCSWVIGRAVVTEDDDWDFLMPTRSALASHPQQDVGHR